MPAQRGADGRFIKGSGGGSAGITWTKDTLTPNVRKLAGSFLVRLGVFMDFQSGKVQDYMRENAPWTDRTGNARQGLFAKPVSNGGTFSIVCYHTMPYGIWLEVSREGRYAIIVPTIPREGRRIMGELTKLLDVS